MSVTGIESVSGRLTGFFREVAVDKSEAALTELLIQGGAYAAEMTPIATSTLINSQGREVLQTATGWRGVLYYGAHYAPYVHNAAGKLKGLGVPRSPASLGFVWDPTGEPRFLIKGMEMAAFMDAEEILKRYYGV